MKTGPAGFYARPRGAENSNSKGAKLALVLGGYLGYAQ
jgi:hypothetical protein